MQHSNYLSVAVLGLLIGLTFVSPLAVLLATPGPLTDRAPTNTPNPTGCSSQTSRNASAAYCGSPPPAQVYINIYVNASSGSCPTNDVMSCRFIPAQLTVATGTTVTWTDTSNLNHSVTSNSTANGSLPSFGTASLAPQQQYSYAFTVPGTYHYYDSYYPWVKGQINVHLPSPAVPSGTRLAVDMDPSTPSIIESSRTLNSASFTVNVVVANVTQLSRWQVCLQYDTSLTKAVSTSLGPSWSGGGVPGGSGMQGGITTYQGDGVVSGSVYFGSAVPGVNVTTLNVLFSVTFQVLNYGDGSLQLTGYLYDSGGYQIQASRQNGSFSYLPYAGLGYKLGYTGQRYPGGAMTFQNNFTNIGQAQVQVSSVSLSTDFGTFDPTSGLPFGLSTAQCGSVFMTITIPSSAYVGNHTVTATIDWQYRSLSNSSSLQWTNAAPIVAVGTLAVQNAPLPGFLQGLVFLLRLLAGPSETLILVGFAAYAGAVATLSILFVRREQRRARGG